MTTNWRYNIVYLLYIIFNIFHIIYVIYHIYKLQVSLKFLIKFFFIFIMYRKLYVDYWKIELVSCQLEWSKSFKFFIISKIFHQNKNLYLHIISFHFIKSVIIVHYVNTSIINHFKYFIEIESKNYKYYLILNIY